MVPEVFLICALQIPPAPAIVHFKGWESVSAAQFMLEYREMKEFFNQFAPGAEFYIMPKRLHVPPEGYRRLPFSWRNHSVYRRILGRNA